MYMFCINIHNFKTFFFYTVRKPIITHFSNQQCGQPSFPAMHECRLASVVRKGASFTNSGP